MAHQSVLCYISAECVVVAILFHLSNMCCSSVFSMILHLEEEGVSTDSRWSGGG